MKYLGSCFKQYVDFLHRFSFKDLEIPMEERVGEYSTDYEALCSKVEDCPWKMYDQKTFRDYCLISDNEANKEIERSLLRK